MLGQGDTPQPPPEAVRAALERLTSSSGFASAERMRRFLTFAVNTTLQGEGATLKEYLVGVEVFDRGPDFDPRIDTIVRVEARRLRKKIEEYYAQEGRLDPVRITLPSGSYAPVFGSRAAPGLPPAAGPRRFRYVLGAVGGLAVLVLAGALALLRDRTAPSTPIASVAVLPFVDLSPGQNQEYFCDGISEELINALSAVPGLKVAARTSAFRYKGKADDIRRIGSELGVEHVVEGSVRTSGHRLRITAQLTRTRDGFHVWSRQFDREFTDVFALQEELARAVASSVGVDVGAGVDLRRAGNVDAYRLFLEGRYYWRQFVPSSTAQAISYFERAIAADPSLAAAYAGLAEAYIQMNVWNMGPPGHFIEKSRQAATRAIELDPRSADAEAALGAISAFYDWDWKACEQHFRRAIEAQPSHVNAHWLYATTCLGPQRRLDEALAEARRAAQLDPLSPLVHTMVGAAHWYRREFDAALAAHDEALRLDPSFATAALFRVFVFLSQGSFDIAAVTETQCICRAYVQAKLGDSAGARTEIERLLAESGNPLAIAAGYVGLGQPDNALDWLEKAVDAKIPQTIWLDFQAPFAALHDAPRYRAIRGRMHLP